MPFEGGLVGGGGEEIWTFLAVNRGDTEITMEYVRPWEKTHHPVKTATIKVSVAGVEASQADLCRGDDLAEISPESRIVRGPEKAVDEPGRNPSTLDLRCFLMAKQSAGLLMYRRREGMEQALLGLPAARTGQGKTKAPGRSPKARSRRERTLSPLPDGSSRRRRGAVPEGDFRPLQATR